MHSNSLWMFEKHAVEYFEGATRVLEIGPTGAPSAYENAVMGALGRRDLQWDTIDIVARPEVTFTATSEYSFPIADESYDIVLSGNLSCRASRPVLDRLCALSEHLRPTMHIHSDL